VFVNLQSLFLQSLVKEMYIWSKLEHPNILRFEGFFLGDDSYPHLVSRWMEDGTVLDYIRRHPGTDLLHIALGIAEGLNYLHLKGIIHSDIKPANILMSGSRVPLLCDFGQSRNLGGLTTFAFSVSASGESKGTISFTSPELLDGTDLKPTEKSDVWAFGMTIWVNRLTQIRECADRYCSVPLDAHDTIR
ncbi:kinase-like protein, partial [Fomitiporia mediterranea MF3/22]|uniref:kinase-like protein n=1 Tax=Fomitiporia mediterranea (strain MF3/22) TaxID=694068 RepID=UPI0004408EFA